MVVVIIAILAAIAVPQYLRSGERSRAAEALQVLGAIRMAEVRYKAFNPASTYTTTLDELDVAMPGASGGGTSTLWSYTVEGTSAGSNAIATRSSGSTKGATVEIDLDSGATCSPANGATYGVSNATC